MRPARTAFLFSLIIGVSRCGVIGSPIAYVDAYPEKKPAAEAAPAPAPSAPEPTVPPKAKSPK